MSKKKSSKNNEQIKMNFSVNENQTSSVDSQKNSFTFKENDHTSHSTQSMSNVSSLCSFRLVKGTVNNKKNVNEKSILDAFIKHSKQRDW